MYEVRVYEPWLKGDYNVIRKATWGAAAATKFRYESSKGYACELICPDGVLPPAINALNTNGYVHASAIWDLPCMQDADRSARARRTFAGNLNMHINVLIERSANGGLTMDDLRIISWQAMGRGLEADYDSASNLRQLWGA